MSRNGVNPGAEPLPGILDEAVRLVEFIGQQGTAARLLGGIAIQLVAREVSDSPFRRTPQDSDLICEAGARHRMVSILELAGYRGDDMFNALNGHRRLVFHDDLQARQVDVFVGGFSMCHVVPLDGRLGFLSRTLSPTDLLLTKIQIFEINAKDQMDILLLLSACEINVDDSGGINGTYIAKLLSRDWGFWRTATLNLERTRAAIEVHPVAPEMRATLTARIDALQNVVTLQPRSLAWRVRSQLGERVKWYQEPEEVS